MSKKDKKIKVTKLPIDPLEVLITKQLIAIGENPQREGLLETPARVVKMWSEIFRGYDPEQRPKVSIFKNGTDGISYDQIIIDTGNFYSHCEHHMVPFFGRYWFAYIPAKYGGIIGLSKVARLVDYHSAKLQIQERLTQDIVNDIWTSLNKDMPAPVGMALIMEGEHLCKTMRGAKKKGTMKTSCMKGVFFTNAAAREELMQLIK